MLLLNGNMMCNELYGKGKLMVMNSQEGLE